jgi:hypothetical protein
MQDPLSVIDGNIHMLDYLYKVDAGETVLAMIKRFSRA